MKIKDLLDPISVHYLTTHNYADVDVADRFYITLRMFYDNHHSWLEVPIQMLLMLGFSPMDFSKFSYVDTKNARFYLEQDVDVATFYERCNDWHERTSWHDDLRQAFFRKDPYQITGMMPEDTDILEVFWKTVGDEWEDVSDYDMLGDTLKDSIMVKPIEGAAFIRDLESNVDGAEIH